MSSRSNSSRIILDLRCLQDPSYARRGVGRHALALLQHAPRRFPLVGLIDPTLPALLPEARDAIDSVVVNAYAAAGGPSAGFIMMSPMTHDPIFSARLMSDPSLLRAAIVYDFIPRRIPERYLPGPTERLGYAIALRWLARCNLFLPISRSSADDLVALLGVTESAIAVTGCPIDPAFEQLQSAPVRATFRHLLLVGGGDPRKNPEVVIRAHARSPTMQTGGGVPLVVGGSYSSEDAKAFRALASANGGRPELIEVPGHVSESALVDLYSRAFAVICASHDEGFSIPIIEAMAAGIPCLASDISAHAELVSDPDCRFPAEGTKTGEPRSWRVRQASGPASAPTRWRLGFGTPCCAALTGPGRRFCVGAVRASRCSLRFHPTDLASPTIPPPLAPNWDGWSICTSSRRRRFQHRRATSPPFVPWGRFRISTPALIA
jgi:glycosyltransferase involved in cell wall biosynthesis